MKAGAANSSEVRIRRPPVAQFFPGVIFGLYWERVTATGVFAGILSGVGMAMILVLSKHDPLIGLNAGFVALCVNVAVTVVASVLTPSQPNGLEGSAGVV
jgi:SSS family solute:Na+ symporter